MANIITTNLSNNSSIEYFINHWKYWHNYEDSTVLVDPAHNIIAFYDRNTSNIDIIQSDLPFDWWFIINNGEGIIIKWIIKYKPYNYEMALRENHNKINELKQKKNIDELNLLYEKINRELSEYNMNYFDNLLKSLSL